MFTDLVVKAIKKKKEEEELRKKKILFLSLSLIHIADLCWETFHSVLFANKLYL